MRITAVIIASNAFSERINHPFSVKSFLLFGALVALIAGLILALKVARNKQEEKTPQNIKKFFGDDILETKKLERTLAVALLAVSVIAISISIYYVWEPTRQAKMTTSFFTRSIRRGQTLYANEATKGYNATQSLSCANCHGGFNPDTGRWAEGGTAQFTLKALKDPTDIACEGDNKFTNPDCVTVSVSWKAPALNTALYKYPIRKADANNHFASSCTLSDQRSVPDCRSQVYDILTYGRPGTPMPAWGVAGGGAKNEQAINDLINFLSMVQLPEDQASQPMRSGAIIKQKKKISVAKAALDKAKESARRDGIAQDKIDQQESVITAQGNLDTEKAALKAIEAKTETQYIREDAIAQAQADVDSATKSLSTDAPNAVIAAQGEYDSAKVAYSKESKLSDFPNPQDYLDKMEKEQVVINLEKQIEEAKVKNDKETVKSKDRELSEISRLTNIADNFLESRDALTSAKATLQIFAPEALVNSKARLAQLQKESDGQLLFEANCARCHTKGWSFFTPSNGRVPLPAPQGTGAFGPQLASTDLLRQFVTSESQFSFISSGSAFQTPYGSRGVGTGRMPGFKTSAGAVLSDDQINEIVNYERTELNGSGANSLGTRNLGSSTPTQNSQADKSSKEGNK